MMNNLTQEANRNSTAQESTQELSSLRFPKLCSAVMTLAALSTIVAEESSGQQQSNLPLQQEFVPRRHQNTNVPRLPGYEKLRTGGVLDLLRGGSRVQENPALSNTEVPKRPGIISAHNLYRIFKNRGIANRARRNNRAVIQNKPTVLPRRR